MTATTATRKKFPPIEERAIETAFRNAMASAGGVQMANSLRRFRMGEVEILLSRDDHGVPGCQRKSRWHISISRAKRDPDWEELKHIQNTLKPGVFFCVPMPPAEYWLSLHPHTFHLEEVKDRNSIEQWKHEGEEVRA